MKTRVTRFCRSLLPDSFGAGSGHKEDDNSHEHDGDDGKYIDNWKTHSDVVLRASTITFQPITQNNSSSTNFSLVHLPSGFSGFGGFFGKHVVDDGNGNDTQKRSNLRLSDDGIQVDHSSSRISSVFTARYKNNIPAVRLKSQHDRISSHKYSSKPGDTRIGYRCRKYPEYRSGQFKRKHHAF